MSAKHQLAAIMFTDVVGYSKIMGSSEKKALDILQVNRRIHKSLLKKYNGKWLKEMGDGILVRFPSASDAVYCASAIMERAKEQNIVLRIGIHLGEIVEENGDVFGDGVNVASRIESVTKPGEIFVSDSVARNVRNKSGVLCTFWDEKELKNIKEPVRIYTLSVTPGKASQFSRHSPPELFNKIKIPALVILILVLGGILSYQFNDAVRSIFSSSINPVVEKSLAVLPFTNLSIDQADIYFSEGIAEDIRSHLAQIPNIRLISRTSVNQYRNTDKAIPAIGKELGARYILEGSVRKGENTARTTVRLIDSQIDELLWTKTYDQPLTDILTVQNDISKRIVSEMRANFVTNLNYTGNESLEAYNHYLKGRHLWQSGNPVLFSQAIEHYEKAISIDPDFALAYAGLADLYLNYAHFGQPSHEVFPKAIEAAQKALEINETLPEALTSLADCMYHYNYEWEEAEKKFKKALSVNPNYSQALWWYSGMLSAMERHDEAISVIEKARKLDPLNAGLLGWSAKTYFWSGNHKISVERFKELNNILPANIQMIPYLWVEYYQAVKPPDIIPFLENNISSLSFNLSAKAALALAYIDQNQPQKAFEIAQELSDLENLTQPHYLALIYTSLKEYDLALDVLENAYQQRDAALIWINVNPAFNPLKNDPRFIRLLKSMNLA